MLRADAGRRPPVTQTVTTNQPGRYGAADRSAWWQSCPKDAALPGTSAEHRTDFARDRARVLHSAALRRLADKTQVVGPGRVTLGAPGSPHLLEVAQIGAAWLAVGLRSRSGRHGRLGP